jgi:NAD(P) transhydrogenase
MLGFVPHPSQRKLDQAQFEFPDLLRAADAVIADQVRTRYRYGRRNRVEVLFGRARLADANPVKV